MRLLLDTVTFLWLVNEPERLPERALALFRSPENETLLSVVSAWEIALKHSLGRLKLAHPPERFVPEMRELHQIGTLALEEAATFQLAKLPDHHRDPFDRMLIAQAIDAGLTLLTPDDLIRRYAVATAW